MPMWASCIGIGRDASSLALDLMEELRPCLADRFVLTLVNNRIIKPADFDIPRERRGVPDGSRAQNLPANSGRSTKRRSSSIRSWKRKFRGEWCPMSRALLLARCLRGDLEDYPPFLWK